MIGDQSTPRWALAILGLAILAYTLAVWHSYGPAEFFPHIDMTASFVIARDCAEGRGCTMEILPDGGSSVLGFGLGAIANHLAALVYATTGDFPGVATLSQVLFALAAALTYVAAARSAGLLAGLVAFVAFMRFPVMEGLYRSQLTVLMYHFIPIFAACAVLLGLWRARGGGFDSLLLTALAVSLAAQTHQTGFALVPSLLALAWMGNPGVASRLGRVAAVLGVFLAAYALASYGVLVHFNPQTVAQSLLALHRQHVWLFPLLVLALIAGTALLTTRRNTAAAMPAELIYLFFAVLPLTPIILLPSVNPRYAFTFAPAFAALIGIAVGLAVLHLAASLESVAALRRLSQLIRSPVAALAALPAVVLLVPLYDGAKGWREPVMTTASRGSSQIPNGQPMARRADRGLGLYDLEPALTPLVRSLGGTYAGSFSRLRSSVTIQRELISAVSMFWPLDGDTVAATSLHAAILPAPPGFSLPAQFDDWSVYRTEVRYDIAVQHFEPYVDTRIIAWQAERSADSAATQWRRILHAPPRGDLMHNAHRWRAMPEVYEFAYPQLIPAGSDRLRIRFALRLAADSAPRALVLQANTSAEHSHAFERIEGVPYQGALPALAVVLRSDGVARDGFVEVSVNARKPHYREIGFLGQPPAIFEFDPEVYPLLAPVLRTIDAGQERLPEVLEPMPSLPDPTSAVQFAPLRSLTDDNGQRMTVDAYFTPDGKRSDSHVPTDVTASFPFVAAVMTLFALLLTVGSVRAAFLPQDPAVHRRAVDSTTAN